MTRYFVLQQIIVAVRSTAQCRSVIINFIDFRKVFYCVHPRHSIQCILNIHGVSNSVITTTENKYDDEQNTSQCEEQLENGSCSDAFYHLYYSTFMKTALTGLDMGLTANYVI